MPPDEGEGDEGETEANSAGACLKELEADAEGDHEPWKRRFGRMGILHEVGVARCGIEIVVFGG